jgi:hypothetical protein
VTDTIDTPVMRSEIYGPGVYEMPDAVYHSDGGSLSSTGARKIIPPGTCAAFRYWRENGEDPKSEYDFGHAAHRYVLTEGAAIEVIDAPDWRSKDARAQRDQARANGQIPILDKDMGVVLQMAAELRRHRTAAAMLSLDRGAPEQSLFWRHPRTGRWCRARLDLLPRAGYGRRYVIADYKTAADASREAFEKAAGSFGYHQQDRFYCDGIRALGIDPDPAFVFVVQEKKPPYLVNVIELDFEARQLADRQNDIAHNRFHRCLAEDRWPGYGDDVDVASLPAWYLRQNGM